MADLSLRPLAFDDWPTVALIYEDGLATGRASFETEVPSWEDWNARQRSSPRVVAVQDW